MATKTTVHYIDDLTGDEDDVSTVGFALDGVLYEIDLSDDHAADLRGELEAYIAAGRRVGTIRADGTVKAVGSGGGRSRGNRSAPKYNRETTKAIREWGKAQGWELNDRGRVPNDVVTAWEQAHQGEAA